MIKINLVPVTLRRKKKSIVAVNMRSVPREVMVGFIGGFVVLLFVVHVFLQLLIFFRFADHARHKKQWEKILPDKEKVDKILGEMRSLQTKIDAIDKVTAGKRILWAQKLNDISDGMPRGVWLNKISVDDKIFLLDGSAVSKSHDEMINIGNLASSLKNKKPFMAGLQNIEVGSIQRRLVRTTEVIDFVITIKLQ